MPDVTSDAPHANALNCWVDSLYGSVFTARQLSKVCHHALLTVDVETDPELLGSITYIIAMMDSALESAVLYAKEAEDLAIHDLVQRQQSTQKEHLKKPCSNSLNKDLANKKPAQAGKPKSGNHVTKTQF